MKLWEHQAAFADDAATLISHIFDSENKCTLGEAFRTKEQAEIYAKEGKGIKDSLHCDRLAIDLNLFDLNGNYLTEAKDYKQYGDFWESLSPNNRWGGNFPNGDANHFERRTNI
jgi:hypothetical protein